MKQEYSDEDDQNHANYLCQFFSDERYIKVDGRPVFVIYRPGDLPNATQTLDTFKSIALSKGLKEPFIVASNSHLWDNNQLISYGFDAILNFRPQLGILPYANTDDFEWARLKRNFKKYKLFDGKMKVFDYQEAVEIMQIIEPKNFDKVIPCAFVGWDNTARRGEKGIVMLDNKPEYFEKELIRIKEKLKNSNSNSNLLFINAWNEWAEGNKLEPDSRMGKDHLEIIKQTKSL
jgi:hypothetical protein